MGADLLALAALLALACWVALTIDRGRRWPGEVTLERDARGAPAGPPDTAVVVPARNESANVESCLGSLAAQHADFARLVYVDDRSSDGTGDAARALAAREGGGKIEVVASPPPPPDWSGKIHALAYGVGRLAAAGSEPDLRWILLTDADIRHPSGSIRALRSIADAGGYDLVSVMVRLRARSAWERLLIPPFVYFFHLIYPFRRVADPRSRSAAAAGGCILVSRSKLESVGGLASISGAVIDDVALARRIKDAGGRIWLGLSAAMESQRAYDDFASIERMVARTAFDQLRYSFALLGAALAGLALFVAAPPFILAAAAVSLDGRAAGAAAAAWGLQALHFLPAVRHHGVRAAYALTLPFASLLYGWMTILSAWSHWRRRRVPWRDAEGPVAAAPGSRARGPTPC